MDDGMLIPTQGCEVAPIGTLDATNAQRLVDAFLQGRNARTLVAYRQDIRDFASFAKVETIDAAARLLLSRGHGEANGLALSYRSHLVERGLSAATVNRRLAALRSLVALGRTLGMVAWTLDVQGLRAEPYRDVRGPGRDALDRVLEKLAKRKDAKGVRDLALLRLLHDLALRRNEALSLDVEHLDMERGSVLVLGKGRTGRVPLTVPPETKAALSAWLDVRGNAPGPLFVGLDRNAKGSRLTGSSVWRIVKGYGLGRPHGLRHLGITEALTMTDGNVRLARSYSRHKNAEVLLRYDDARNDGFGEVARKVAAGE